MAFGSGTDPNVGAANQFQPGQSGNPTGRPKGARSLSYHIQKMMNDPEFETWLQHPSEGVKKFKGTPMEAIITVAIMKAAAGDKDARKWLGEFGFGSKFEFSSDPENPVAPGVVDPQLMIRWQEFLEQQSKDASA